MTKNDIKWRQTAKKKVKHYRPTDGPTDRQTDRAGQSRVHATKKSVYFYMLSLFCLSLSIYPTIFFSVSLRAPNYGVLSTGSQSPLS